MERVIFEQDPRYTITTVQRKVKPLLYSGLFEDLSVKTRHLKFIHNLKKKTKKQTL